MSVLIEFQMSPTDRLTVRAAAEAIKPKPRVWFSSGSATFFVVNNKPNALALCEALNSIGNGVTAKVCTSTPAGFEPDDAISLLAAFTTILRA